MPRSLQESKLANLDMNLLVSLDALLAGAQRQPGG